jgi:hypothetical protein
MMAADVEDLCGQRHARSPERRGHRWGRTRGKIGYQGGKVDIVRPRVRGADGDEMPLPSWTAAATEDWLGKTAMNLMGHLRTDALQHSLRRTKHRITLRG